MRVASASTLLRITAASAKIDFRVCALRELIILKLYLKLRGCHAAHRAESTSACCRTVCTAAA